MITITLITCFVIIRLSIGWAQSIDSWSSGLVRKQRRDKRSIVFDDYYIDVKQFYVREFKIVPCIRYIGSLNTSAAYEFIKNGNAGNVLSIYQRTFYNWEHKELQFTTTIFKIEGEVMIELSSASAEILHGANNYKYGSDLVTAFSEFKAPEKEKAFEINIITQSHNGLELKSFDIKPTALDISLYYNDDFRETDAIIKKRLSLQNAKGIVLLHGLPGTGKTTYLRHLIGGLKKKVLFVAPGVAANLMDPDFIELLISNPNSVLVIEDAENIIMDRKISGNPSVSNLLNISDGLLADFLNVQIICTFNNSVTLVDSALLRKGRLIAKYEFGKLSILKAQKLSDHLGLKQSITKPMTLAEITNYTEKEQAPAQTTVIGFRRNELQMN